MARHPTCHKVHCINKSKATKKIVFVQPGAERSNQASIVTMNCTYSHTSAIDVNQNNSNNHNMVDIPPNKPTRRRSNEYANGSDGSGSYIPGEKVTSSRLTFDLHDITTGPSTPVESRRMGRRRSATIPKVSSSEQQHHHPTSPVHGTQPLSPSMRLKKKKREKATKTNNRATSTTTNSSNDVTTIVSPNNNAALSRTRRQRLSLSSSSLSLSSSTTLESIIESMPCEWS